jgi:UDP-N-acetyl-D-glucosamine dehydrogenase
LLGVSFKKDIGDIRNSPALTIAQVLNEKISNITYNDPHVPEIDMGNEQIRSTPLNEDMLKSQSAVIILVDHSSYDLELILANSQLVIDTRNLTGDSGVHPNVIKL